MIVTAVIRAFQLLFAIIVLAISVSLAKGQVYDKVPATTGYSAFAGGIGMIFALVGLAAIFFEFLGGVVLLAIDALAALIFMAAGIAWSIGLKGVNCDDIIQTGSNKLLNEGCKSGKDNGVQICGIGFEIGEDGKIDSSGNTSELHPRCVRAFTADAFCFIAFIFAVVTAALAFWKTKRGGKPGLVV